MSYVDLLYTDKTAVNVADINFDEDFVMESDVCSENNLNTKDQQMDSFMWVEQHLIHFVLVGRVDSQASCPVCVSSIMKSVKKM